MLLTSDDWWISLLSRRPSEPAYHIVDWRISIVPRHLTTGSHGPGLYRHVSRWHRLRVHAIYQPAAFFLRNWVQCNLSNTIWPQAPPLLHCYCSLLSFSLSQWEWNTWSSYWETNYTFSVTLKPLLELVNRAKNLCKKLSTYNISIILSKQNIGKNSGWPRSRIPTLCFITLMDRIIK